MSFRKARDLEIAVRQSALFSSLIGRKRRSCSLVSGGLSGSITSRFDVEPPLFPGGPSKADDSDGSRTPRIDEDVEAFVDFSDRRDARFGDFVIVSFEFDRGAHVEASRRRERNAMHAVIPRGFSFVPFESGRRVRHLMYIH